MAFLVTYNERLAHTLPAVNCSIHNLNVNCIYSNDVAQSLALSYGL